MSKKGNSGDVLRCSFCNKSQRDVKKLIAGPTVYICDECVDICLDIIAEDRMLDQQQDSGLPKPKEIKALLQGKPEGTEPWWEEMIGVFANDPVFAEIDRLGREIREKERRQARRPAKKKKVKS